MPKNVHQVALAGLLKMFKEAGEIVYREHVLREKAPLTSVMNALTEACYQTMGGSIVSKMIMAGQMPANQSGLSLKQKMKEREMVAQEIMKIISLDLDERDPANEYHVAIVKRERRGPKK